MGNKNTTTLINKTKENMEIREFRGKFMGENDYFSKITVESGKQTDLNSTKYGGGDCHGGQLSNLKIFCNGSFLQRSSGGELVLPRDLVLAGDLVLPGDKFIDYETVTIIEPAAEDQNSTGVVKYKVEFQPRKASAFSLEVSRDLVLDQDNGWSVQHFANGSVTLTLEEGITMTLDPSKLFASDIVHDPETTLLVTVLNFWPRIFANLYVDKDKLRKTVCIVNDLMHQAKLYCADKSRVEGAKVVGNVRDLNELCAAKVEWYLPLFPGMEDQFTQVAEKTAEVDREKLKRFETTIKPLLRQPSPLPEQLNVMIVND